MNSPTTLISQVLREPLVHIALLGAGLFLLDSLATSTSKPEIYVSTSTQNFIVKGREDLLLRTLSNTEREEMIEQYIADEILYNEAYQRGLDRGDTRMRRSLIFKMRGLLAGEIGEPTEKDLRSWFEENTQQYMTAEAWTFQQIYFRNQAAIPDNILEELKTGGEEIYGDTHFQLRREMTELTAADLSLKFGPNASRQIIAIDDSNWHGPITSKLGFHFVRLVGRIPPEPLSFDAMKPYLAGDWRLAMVAQRVDAEVSALRSEYDIVIEP